MSLDQYASLAEIVASLGVIASLLYVALQLKQNTEATRAQSREALYSGSLAELFKMMDDPELMLLMGEKRELSPLEQSKLAAFFLAEFRGREYSWLQYENRMIDEAQWKTELGALRMILDSRKARVWWEKFGETAFSEEYVQFVERLIQRAPATDTSCTMAFRWFSVREGASE